MADIESLPAMRADVVAFFVADENGGRAVFCVTYAGTREQLINAGLCVPAQFPKKARIRESGKRTPAAWGRFALHVDPDDETRWKLIQWPPVDEVLAGIGMKDLSRWWLHATRGERTGDINGLPEHRLALQRALLNAWRQANPGMND